MMNNGFGYGQVFMTMRGICKAMSNGTSECAYQLRGALARIGPGFSSTNKRRSGEVVCFEAGDTI
jgi:hypothetical protein